MADRLNITEIVIASNNPGKVREINELLATSTICVVPQSDFGVPEADETGLSFIENAILKARNAAEHTGRAAIADDSGIVVDALNGEPGILSARYAGGGASDEDNLWKLVNEVKSLPEDQRTAHFVCVMAYIRHASDPVPLIAEGVWDGIAMTEPREKMVLVMIRCFMSLRINVPLQNLSRRSKIKSAIVGRHYVNWFKICRCSEIDFLS